jgi:hypothetical protein
MMLKRKQATFEMDDQTWELLGEVAEKNGKSRAEMGYFAVREMLGLPPVEITWSHGDGHPIEAGPRRGRRAPAA